MLRGSPTHKFAYSAGHPRGTLAIRVDGALVYQKAPGRDPANPQPTPAEFARVTRELMRCAGLLQEDGEGEGGEGGGGGSEDVLDAEDTLDAEDVAAFDVLHEVCVREVARRARTARLRTTRCRSHGIGCGIGCVWGVSDLKWNGTVYSEIEE